MKRLQEQAAYIATLEPDFKKLSDAELQAKTVEFRERIERGESLEDLLFEAFAAVRESRVRESDQRIFDVQMMGGIVLHEGDIAEMKTGEGKTFVASLALYLNALAGQGVHLVTVNDYLAQRDAEWNRGVFERLGINVAFIETMMPFDERRDAYNADVTYGTNSEFGFDYLRDNMSIALDGVVQRGPLLRDRGRGRLDPRRRGAHAADHLGRADDGREDLQRLRAHRPDAARRPVEGHEARGRGALAGVRLPLRREAQDRRPRPRPGSRRSSGRCGSTTSTTRTTFSSSTTCSQSLKAEALYKRDVDYVVQDGEVKIVDEFTGRIMEGRRWSEGLHQAIEAKERRRRPGGAPDPRDDHPAELLPPLREARRHDRHREDGGEGVRRDLRPERRRDPDQRRRRPRRQERPDLQDEGGEVRRRRRGHQGARASRASRCSSAPSPSRPPST